MRLSLHQKCSLLFRVLSFTCMLTAAFQAVQAAPFIQDPSNRVETNFNMSWKFKSGTVTGTPQAISYDDASWETVSLPHPLKMVTSHLDGYTDCNNQGTFDRTTGWFRKHFTLAGQTGKKVFVEFQTVMQVATVYINGVLVGTHIISGYDSFHFDITGYVSFTGDNVIAVFVDNRINTTTPPDFDYGGSTACTGWPNGMDFILFGGINGDVNLVCTDNLHIGFQWEAKNAGVVVTTPSASAASATVKVVTTVKNENTASRIATITTTIIDAANEVVTTMTSTAQNIAAGGSASVTLTSSAIASPHLWSPDNPYLYKVYVSVQDGSTFVEGKFQKFGIRWFDFNTTTGFHLNGQSVKLIGLNRHSAWPFVGGAIPNTVHRREAQQIKSHGFNWIRLSHYPHDPDFLDALDELGIMALEEGPTWVDGASPYVHSANAAWYSNLQTAFRKEIRRDINHPCIIVWQAAINHGGCDATLHPAAHEEDSTRYIGQCTTTGLGVGCPMCFTGYDPWSAPSIPTGGALCIEHTGHTFRTMRFFTTSWPNELRMVQHSKRHWEEVGLSRATASNAGLAAWAGYDYNSFHSSGVDGANGTAAANDRNIVFHGLFDLFRIPKFAAFWYKTELTATPLVFIANFWTAGSPRDTVTVFSNCDSVELFLNGVSRGKKAPARDNTYLASLNHPPFFFTGLTFTSGTLIALGRSGGVVTARDTIMTPGTPTRLKVETDPDTILADGADFARVIVSVCDANGTVVPTSSASITMTASGAGRIISENPITADEGMIIFLARGDTAGGTMTVSASSGTLTPDSKTITVIIPPSVGIKNVYVSTQAGFIAGMQPKIFKLVGNRFMLPAGISKAFDCIEVFDIQGRLVLRTAISKDLKIIDLSKTVRADGVLIVRALNRTN